MILLTRKLNKEDHIQIQNYRGAAAAVIVYDVTNRDSFDGAKSWVNK